MKEERDLIREIGAIAHDYRREAVIGAVANILLNAVRQTHPTLGAAEEELRDLHDKMTAALRKSHYHQDGSRNDRRIVLPSLRLLIPELN